MVCKFSMPSTRHRAINLFRPAICLTIVFWASMWELLHTATPACLTYPPQFLLSALYRYAVATPAESFTKNPLNWPAAPPNPLYGVISGEVYWNNPSATTSVTLLTCAYSGTNTGLKLTLKGTGPSSFDLMVSDLGNTVTQKLYSFTTNEAFFFRLGLDYNTKGTPSVQILRASVASGSFDPTLFVTDSTILANYDCQLSMGAIPLMITVGGTPASGNFVGTLYNFQVNFQTTAASTSILIGGNPTTVSYPAYSNSSSRSDPDRIYAHPGSYSKYQRLDTVGYGNKHLVFQDPNFSGLSIFLNSTAQSTAADPLTDESDHGISMSRYGFAKNAESRIPGEYTASSAMQHVMSARIALQFPTDGWTVLGTGCAAFNSYAENLRTHTLYGFKFLDSYYQAVPNLAAVMWGVTMVVSGCAVSGSDYSFSVQFQLRKFDNPAPISTSSSYTISTTSGQANMTVAFELSRGLIARDIAGKARVYLSTSAASVPLAFDTNFTISSTMVPGTYFYMSDFMGNFAGEAPVVDYFPLFRLVYQMAYYTTGQLLVDSESCFTTNHTLFIGNSMISPLNNWIPLVCKNPSDLAAGQACSSFQTSGSCKFFTNTCLMCNHGYYLSGGACLACPSNCQRCSDQYSCSRCKKGYVKSSGNCVLYSTVVAPTNLYYPAGQSAVESVTFSFTPNTALVSCDVGNTYYCVAGSVTLTGTVPSTVVMAIELAPGNPISTFSEFGSCILLLNSQPVAFGLAKGSTDTVFLSYFAAGLAPGAYTIEVRAKAALKLVTGKVVSTAEDYTKPCLQNSSSGCLFCNYQNYLLQYGNCLALGPGAGVGFQEGYQGFAEYQMGCAVGVARCKPNAPSEAYSCIPGYYMAGSTCLVCTAPCDTCTGGPNNCQTCQAGLILNSPGSSPRCTISCLTGFYRDDATNTCQPCVLPCSQCSGPTVCTACVSGYILSVSQCQVQCSNGFFRDTATNTCSKCISPCETCQSQSICTNCTQGFTLDTKTSQCGMSSVIEVKYMFSWNKLTKILSLQFSQEVVPSLLDAKSTLFTYNSSVVALDFSFRNQSTRTRTISIRVEYLLNRQEVHDEQVLFQVLTPLLYTLPGSASSPASQNRLLQGLQYRISAGSSSLPTGISYYQDFDTTRAASTASKVATTSAVAISSVASLVQGGGSFAALIKLTQYTEALLLSNVLFPSNFRNFVNEFSGYFVQLLSNPLDSFGYNDCDLPDSFIADGYNCLYIQNNSICLMVLCIFVTLRIMLWGIQASALRFGKQLKLVDKVNGILNCSFFMALLDSAIFDLVLPALVNLTLSPFDESYSIFNAILSVGSLATVCLVIYSTWVVSRHRGRMNAEQPALYDMITSRHEHTKPSALHPVSQLEENRGVEVASGIEPHTSTTREPQQISGWTKFLQRVESKIIALDLRFIWEEYTPANRYGQYRILAIQVLTIITSFSLAFLNSYPLAQLILMAVPQLGLAFATLILRPYESRVGNIKTGVIELLLAAAVSISIILVKDPDIASLSEYSREAQLGLTLIIIVGSIFGLMFIFSLVEGFAAVKELAAIIFGSSKVKPNLRLDSGNSMVPTTRPPSSHSPNERSVTASSKLFWPSSKKELSVREQMPQNVSASSAGMTVKIKFQSFVKPPKTGLKVVKHS